MPEVAAVRQAEQPLIDAYRTSWSRVVAMQQQLVDDPLQATKIKNLRQTQRSIEAVMDQLDSSTHAWIGDQLPQVYTAGGQAGASAIGEDFTWSTISQAAVEDLATNHFGELLDATQFVKDSSKQLIRTIARDEALQSAIEGKTAQQAAREMARILADRGIAAIVYKNGARHGLGEYAESAIRTTTAKAYNYGTLNGAPGVKYFECFDGPDCGLSAHDAGEIANGLVLDRDTCLAYPISHPNCVSPQTKVQSVGDIELAFRIPWVGPIITILTRNGRRVSVGPNHPILTRRGWQRANEIKPGDEIISRSVQGSTSPLSSHIDLVQMPTIEHVFSSLRASNGMIRTPSTPMDFHGDGEFGYGEIEIVGATRELLLEKDSPFHQKRRELSLVLADAQLPGVSGLSLSDRVRAGSKHSGDSSFRRARVSGPRADLAPGLYELLSEPLSIDLELRLQDLHGLSGTVASDDGWDLVVDRWKVLGSGHVYDLQTSSGLYWADAILSHNCRRAFGPRPDITNAADAKAANPTTLPEQTVAQRAQDAERAAVQTRRGVRDAQKSAVRQSRLPASRVEKRASKLASRSAAKSEDAIRAEGARRAELLLGRPPTVAEIEKASKQVRREARRGG